MTVKLLTLKHNIEKNINILKKKHPISPLLVESIEILIDMEASEEEMNSWVNIQKKFIRDIEKDITLIEEEKRNLQVG